MTDVSAADRRSITVAGAGIFGLWQALTLARAGHDVQIVEASADPLAGAASRYAGAMLAPFCEAEASEPIIAELGIAGSALWIDTYPGIVRRGTLVVVAARDRAEIVRFARMTSGHELVDGKRIGELEPDLAERFTSGLFFADEAHMDPRAAMAFLLSEVRRAGALVRLGQRYDCAIADTGRLVVDCRGMAARAELPDLRGVRGERVLIRSGEVRISRVIRLLHPRHPLYIVPWADGVYMVGATVIESEDDGPMTVRSALELLGAAYAVHPGFAEAEILELGAGVRPAFPDHVPRAIVRGRVIHVNGAYRHGFLLAPVLAKAVADYIATGAEHPLLKTPERS